MRDRSYHRSLSRARRGLLSYDFNWNLWAVAAIKDNWTNDFRFNWKLFDGRLISILKWSLARVSRRFLKMNDVVRYVHVHVNEHQMFVNELTNAQV